MAIGGQPNVVGRPKCVCYISYTYSKIELSQINLYLTRVPFRGSTGGHTGGYGGYNGKNRSRVEIPHEVFQLSLQELQELQLFLQAS